MIYEQDEDTWVATSPEVPNWTVVGDSYEEAHQLAEEGVRFGPDGDDVKLKHFVSRAGGIDAAQAGARGGYISWPTTPFRARSWRGEAFPVALPRSWGYWTHEFSTMDT